MLHYVRGDGGMIVVPKEELVRWIEANEVDTTNVIWLAVDEKFREGYQNALHYLLDELEAMGR